LKVLHVSVSKNIVLISDLDKVNDLDSTLEHTLKKMRRMRDTHDDERKRWAARDVAFHKAETQKREFEAKYINSKVIEKEIQHKLRKMVHEVETKDKNSLLIVNEHQKQSTALISPFSSIL